MYILSYDLYSLKERVYKCITNIWFVFARTLILLEKVELLGMLLERLQVSTSMMMEKMWMFLFDGWILSLQTKEIRYVSDIRV